MVTWRRAAVVALAIALVAGTAVSARAQESKAVLVLHTYGVNAPARLAFDSALAAAFRDATGVRVDLHIETLDPNRFGSEVEIERTRTYLRAKYADKKIAVLAVVHDRALSFALNPAEPLLPGVPVAAVVARLPEVHPERVSLIWSGALFGDSVALAMKLHPQARQIVLIDGVQPAGGGSLLYDEAVSQIASAAPHLPLISLRDLPLDEVLLKVQSVPKESIIMVARQVIGRGGGSIVHRDAVQEVARVASGPVYVTVDSLIGTGAVGGIVLSFESEARQLAKLALRLAADPSLQLPPERETPVAMFDWRQLRRFGIDEDLLPAGSVVSFREFTTWDRYKHYIVVAGTLLVVQAGLIIGLVVQHVRRRRTEFALRESERHFRVMADTAPVLIWRSNVNGGCEFFNKPWLEFRGRTLEQEQQLGWLEGVHPDDAHYCRHSDRNSVRARVPFHLEYRLRRADGEYRWVLDVGVPRYDDGGRFAGYIGSALDITDRKQIEQRNQELAGRLINAQEQERSRIARDLHDDVSQQLAAVSIMLSSLRRTLRRSQPAEAEAAVAALQERTTALAEALRHVSHELHPGALEHAGLAAALTHHCAEVQRHHGVTVNFIADDDLDRLDVPLALCLYRVTQEALANVVRHAQATVASIELVHGERGVELHIVDDGVGFDTAKRSDAGLGLRSIDERVRLVSGVVRIESQPGTGTKLLVEIPLPASVTAPDKEYATPGG